MHCYLREGLGGQTDRSGERGYGRLNGLEVGHRVQHRQLQHVPKLAGQAAGQRALCSARLGDAVGRQGGVQQGGPRRGAPQRVQIVQNLVASNLEIEYQIDL